MSCQCRVNVRREWDLTRKLLADGAICSAICSAVPHGAGVGEWGIDVGHWSNGIEKVPEAGLGEGVRWRLGCFSRSGDLDGSNSSGCAEKWATLLRMGICLAGTMNYGVSTLAIAFLTLGCLDWAIAIKTGMLYLPMIATTRIPIGTFDRRTIHREKIAAAFVIQLWVIESVIQ